MAKRVLKARGARGSPSKKRKKRKDRRGKTSEKEKAIVLEKLRALGYM